MELMLFTNDVALAKAAYNAKIDRLVIDLERKNKSTRQQGYNLEINETGESTLFIFQDSISSLSSGDNLGVFDANGVVDATGNTGEILVGSGVWTGEQLEVVAISSQDLSEFGGPILPGSSSGNSMVLKVWKADELVEYTVDYDIDTGTGTFDLGSTNLATYVAAGSTNPYGSTEGSITISEFTNTSISGTFSFTAERVVTGEDGTEETQTVQITEGSFTNIPNNSGDGGGGSGEDAVFEVELDGDLFESEQIVDAVLNEDGLLISATQGNRQVGFQIFDPSVGTFDINAETGEAIVLYDSDISDVESTAYASSSGTLEITELDMANGTVSGTFSGVLQDLFMQEADIQMTNGNFENISFRP